MQFTGEITLGNIAIVVTLITIAIGIGRRFGGMEQLLKGHALTLSDHAKRLDNYEGRLVEVVGQVQRVVGRIEATQDRIDRATGYRKGEG